MVVAFALIGIAQAQSAPHEIAVRHVRPSSILKVMRIQATPNAIEADDSRGVILVRAGQELRDQVQSFVNLLDVRPRRVRLQFVIDSPIDRAAVTTSMTVANNSKYRFSAESLDLDLATSARFNDDGTITVFLDSAYRGSKSQVVFRMKSGESSTLQLGDKVVFGSKSPEAGKARLAGPSLVVTAEILDEAVPRTKESALPAATHKG